MVEIPVSKRKFALTRLDWISINEPASSARTLLASVVSVVGALSANAGLVRIATSASPSIKNYSHFRFIDFGSLTVLGVAAACAAWFVVSRISSSPRSFFIRLAIGVTIVLLFPDLLLLSGHQPVMAVLTLMSMHLVMALLTYNVLVRVAPVRVREYATEQGLVPTPAKVESTNVADVRIDTTSAPIDAKIARSTWWTMTVAVGVEFVVGLSELFYVPFSRPNGYFPAAGVAFSLAHALLGGFLAIAAVSTVLLAAHEDRVARIGAIGGCVGVVLAGAGGAICYYHSLRLEGFGLMFVGASVSFFAYLTPLIDKPASNR